ncbi:hypothetical protein SELSPUOL_02095 [Selenomonas sputigena ATCC 35185]|uniref:Uncharacterized protein n=1 Tax=Selenomonas sputigena (strain ATCC 35185 / DSM 20758 / CCUG 44933 / VPI D19B-28) TaxID=546271 RepID=C9LX92_SELS3|nr:hypothetical protein SELSPUOL_02095 [Selenomonas sputigena ATCC 35185]
MLFDYDTMIANKQQQNKKRAQTRPRQKIRLSILAMFLHIVDGTAPIDVDVRRFPKTCQSRLEALDIGRRVDHFLAEVAQILVRHADLMLLGQIFFHGATAVLIIQDDGRRLLFRIVFDVAELLLVLNRYAVSR